MLFKKKLNELVVEVESLARELGEDIGALYSELSKLSKDKIYKEIAQKYRKRQSRVEAYRDVISEDLLKLIETLEKNRQDVPEVLEEYNKYYRIIKTAEESLEGQIRKSIFSFLAISLVTYALLGKFANLGEEFISSMGKMAQGIMNYTPYVLWIFKVYVIVYLSITILLFYVFKRVNPITKKLYNFLDSVKVLLILKISLNVGLPPSQIVVLLRDGVGVKVDKKYVEVIEVIKVLDNYLEGIEKIALSLSLKGGIDRTVMFINSILRRKMSRFEETFKILKSSVDLYFKIGQTLLLIIAVLGYGAFMMLILQIVSKATS